MLDLVFKGRPRLDGEVDDEVVHDVAASLGGVFAHVEVEDVGDGVGVIDFDGGEAHVGADELFEFVGGDFAEAFEAGDFGGFAEFVLGGGFFFFGVAVDGFFFGADAEEGGFEDEDVATEDEGFEEAEEEGDHEVADVESVDVGVGGEDDFVVAEPFDAVLDVEGAHEVVEFVVFVDGIAFEVADVEGFAFEGEDGLGVGIAATDDGAGGGLAFGDEDHGFVAAIFAEVEVEFAVLELGDADGDGFGAFAGHFFDGLKFAAKFFGFGNFEEDFFGDVGVAVEEVGDDLLDLFDEFAADFGVAEFVFGLGFEHGIFEADGDGANHAFADVVAFVAFFGVFVDGFEHAFAEGAEVGAAVAGVLAVDEGEVGFVVAGAVGEGDFEHFVAVVKGAVEGFVFGFFFDEVEEAAGGDEFLAIVDEGETGVEVGIEAEAAGDEFFADGEVAEDFVVGNEVDEGAVGFVGGFALIFFDEGTALEDGFGEFAFAIAANGEAGGEGIDGFGADAVEADAELEDVVVVLGAGVDGGDAVDEFAVGDAASVVADGDDAVVDGDVDFFAVAHDVFVDGVIDDFFDEDVDAVVVVGAVADAPDVHAGAQSDVLEGGEGLDLAFVVDGGFAFGHGVPWGCEVVCDAGSGDSSSPGSAGWRARSLHTVALPLLSGMFQGMEGGGVAGVGGFGVAMEFEVSDVSELGLDEEVGGVAGEGFAGEAGSDDVDGIGHDGDDGGAGGGAKPFPEGIF